MTLQSSVALQMGFGVVGEVFDDGPRRAQPYTLNSGDASYNVFGRGFSVSSEGVAAAGNSGGTHEWAGILINPKEAKLTGTSGGGPLAASLTLANYEIGQLMTEGQVVVALPAAAAIGDLVVYDNTTGILSTIAPGANLPVGKSFAYARVVRFTVSAAGLAVIELNHSFTVPVLA